MEKRQIKLSDKVPTAFRSYWQEVRRKDENRKLYKVLKGGRGSGKSSVISLSIIKKMMQDKVNALVVRKVGNTLSDSVAEQLLWAINDLGVKNKWHMSRNPLRLTYKPFGNYVIFRGADKPEKIKSIKSSKYPITILWVEEAADFLLQEQVTTIVNSIVRAQLSGGINYDIILSYNPPKRKNSWVNKVYNDIDLPENVYVHHSTYLDNPFISREFIIEAESTRKKNEPKYRWEYGGEAIGTGLVPFNNLTFRKITVEELNTFDNLVAGIDFGYGGDPLAYLVGHYDITRKRLYIFDELYGRKVSLYRVSQFAKDRGYIQVKTICDSASPRDIDTLCDYGMWCYGAKKSPGSVESGERWLDEELDEIIIDPEFCPNCAREFNNIDYELDQNGEPTNRLSGKDNHCLTGDTLVDTIEGPIPIANLVGKVGRTYCYDEKNKRKEIGIYYNAHIERENADVYNITFSNGKHIKATDDHPLLSTFGWKETKHLKKGDLIININSSCTLITNIDYAGKQDVYDMTVSLHHNFSVEGGLIVHNCIDTARYMMDDDMRRSGKIFTMKSNNI